MAREKEDFRGNLELLTQMFPNRVTLTVNEASAIIDCDRDTLTNDTTFPVKKIKSKLVVPVVALARWLS